MRPRFNSTSFRKGRALTSWLPALTASGPAIHALLRMGAALLFVEHALMKLFGWFGAPHAVPLMSLLGVAGVIELVGGTLLFLGLFVQPVAFVLAGEMIVAYLTVHAPRSPWPLENQGELALLYALIFWFLATHGAGPFSLDALRSRDPFRGR